MNDLEIIDLTPENIADYGVCGYKDVNKHIELRRKIDWFKELYPMGLRIKVLYSKFAGYQGMLEYIPGKYAHRPVNAEGYLFIHCIFVGFKNEFKGKGYATLLIDECMNEAKEKSMEGVAAVTRKGSFMAKSDIFIKRGFAVVDRLEPDFELLVYKFNEKSKNPTFKPISEEHLNNFKDGLTILRSAQCPYSEKNVNAIIKSASKMDLKINLVELNSYEQVQNTPCGFGTFCIIYSGEIISYHPISNTRFENIMAKTKI